PVLAVSAQLFASYPTGEPPARNSPRGACTAGPAYRAWAGQQRDAISGLAQAANTMAAITKVPYAAEEVASFGVGTPLVVEQATTLYASWTAKIGRGLRGLLSSLRELGSLGRRLGQAIEYQQASWP